MAIGAFARSDVNKRFLGENGAVGLLCDALTTLHRNYALDKQGMREAVRRSMPAVADGASSARA